MKPLCSFVIFLFCFQLAAVSVHAQDDSDWWHTTYENQAAVGGSSSVTSNNDTTASTTLPVAGNTETTLLICMLGLSLIAAGAMCHKFAST